MAKDRQPLKPAWMLIGLRNSAVRAVNTSTLAIHFCCHEISAHAVNENSRRLPARCLAVSQARSTRYGKQIPYSGIGTRLALGRSPGPTSVHGCAMTQLLSIQLAAPPAASLLPGIVPQGESDASIEPAIPGPAGTSNFAAALQTTLQTVAPTQQDHDQALTSDQPLASINGIPKPPTQTDFPNIPMNVAEAILVSARKPFFPELPESASQFTTVVIDGLETAPQQSAEPTFKSPEFLTSDARAETTTGIKAPKLQLNEPVLDAQAEAVSLLTNTANLPSEVSGIVEVWTGDQLEQTPESSDLEWQSVLPDAGESPFDGEGSSNFSDVAVAIATPFLVTESTAPATPDVTTFHPEQADTPPVEASVQGGFQPASDFTPAIPTDELSAGATQPEELVQSTDLESEHEVSASHIGGERPNGRRTSHYAAPAVVERVVDIVSATQSSSQDHPVVDPHEEYFAQSQTPEEARVKPGKADSDQTEVLPGGTAREVASPMFVSAEISDIGLSESAPHLSSGTGPIVVSEGLEPLEIPTTGQQELLDPIIASVALADREAGPGIDDQQLSPGSRQTTSLVAEPPETRLPSTSLEGEPTGPNSEHQAISAESTHVTSPAIDQEVAYSNPGSDAGKQELHPDTVESGSRFSRPSPDAAASDAESVTNRRNAISSVELNDPLQRFDSVERAKVTPDASRTIPDNEPATAPLENPGEASAPELAAMPREQSSNQTATSELGSETTIPRRELTNGSAIEHSHVPTQPVRFHLPQLTVAGSEQSAESLTVQISGEATPTGNTQDSPVSIHQITASSIEASAIDHHQTPASGGRVRATAPVVAQLAARSQLESGPDFERVQIQLDPPELGRVMLDVVRSEGGLSARIVANEPAARAILEVELPALRRSLGEAGVELANVDVSQGDSGFAGSREDARLFRTQIPTHRLRSLNSENTGASNVSEAQFTHASDHEHVNILA